MYKKYPRQMLRSRVISEGIRTVYPGATSGLYEEGEVASFSDAPRAAGIDGDGQPDAPTRTGEIIEALEVRDEPEFHRDPTIPGITKIRNNLNKLRRDGGKATDLERSTPWFTPARTTCKRSRMLSIPCGPAWARTSTASKSGSSAAAKSLPERSNTSFSSRRSNECTSHQELQSWLTKNGDVVGQLDGEESRKFEAIYDERATALKAVAVVSA
jgi:hypothetical protein